MFVFEKINKLIDTQQECIFHFKQIYIFTLKKKKMISIKNKRDISTDPIMKKIRQIQFEKLYANTLENVD